MNRIELDQFCHISYVGGLSSSPDEDKLCFIKSIANLEDNKYESNIWLYETEKGIRKLTGSNSDRQVTWLDNEQIAFFSSRIKEDTYKKTRVYKMNIHGGEAELLLETCHEINQFKVLDETRWLVSLTYHPTRFELQQQQDDKALTSLEKDNEGWNEFDEIPFWSNGDGITNKQRTALGILDLTSLKVELLTEPLTDVYHFDLSADKKYVAVVHNTFDNLMRIYNQLSLIDLLSKETKDLSFNEPFVYERCQFNSENQIILLGKYAKNYGLNENAVFYKVNPHTGESQLYSVNFDSSVGSSVGSDAKYASGGNCDWQFTKDGMIFSSTNGYSCNLFILKPDGQVEPLTQIDGAIFDYKIMGNTIVFNALLDCKPMALYQSSDNMLTPLTTDNIAYGESIFLSTPEHFSFENREGITLDGWVMKPRDFDLNKKYPAILNIHGGPKTVYGSVYYHEMQYWASEGFVVMFCNPRGSDGKGNAFADIRGQYGTIDYNDIMDFVDEALAQNPWINAEKLGVTGGSYGGYMTNWIIGHTNRFKAAATQRSISNWISMYGTTDIGYFFASDQIGETPWSNADKLWDHSPMKYADQIKTPLLVLHSEEDYRCWVAEGIQMFTSLKVNNIPSKMVLFKGENHELSRSGKPKNRVKRLSEITQWMKTYLEIVD